MTVWILSRKKDSETLAEKDESLKFCPHKKLNSENLRWPFSAIVNIVPKTTFRATFYSVTRCKFLIWLQKFPKGNASRETQSSNLSKRRENCWTRGKKPAKLNNSSVYSYKGQLLLEQKLNKNHFGWYRLGHRLWFLAARSCRLAVSTCSVFEFS